MFFEGIFGKGPAIWSPTFTPIPIENQPFFVEEEEEQFDITAKQFAHRLVPTYLEGTHIVGIHSHDSVDHWDRLLTLWISNKALPLSMNISTQHLSELRETLQEYGTTLNRYQSTHVHECRLAAEITLKEIQMGLQMRKVHYTPAGYMEGVNNDGHAIPLKLRIQGHQIEAVALNLGEGVHMHSLTDWSVSGGKFHFQSFPALIHAKNLFSERGVDAFTYLILMQIQQCPPQVKGYSAEDIYGILYTLGRGTSSFHSTISTRSCKPQLGDICADMAIVLLIKDFLIDRGYTKDALRRFFYLEHLCDILFFYKNLKNGDLDLWTLLKNGLREFSIHALKCRETVFSQQEIEHIYTLLKPIALETNTRIQVLKRITIAPLEPQSILNISACDFSPFQFEIIESTVVDRSCNLPFFASPLVSPTCQNVLSILKTWLQTAQNLSSKRHLFVYRAISYLPVPHPKYADFWDQVSACEIDEIIMILASLANCGMRSETIERGDPIYPQISILTVVYTIVDKLIRRKWGPFFKGFASPFSPSRFDLHANSDFFSYGSKLSKKESFFDFLWLPMGPSNIQWGQVREYFESIQGQSTCTLFALGTSELNIEKGVKELRQGLFHSEEWGPVHSHLKFLEPFLEKLDPCAKNYSLEEQFTLLWMNEGNRLIPQGIEILYYLAHCCWHIFQGRLVCNEMLRVHRTRQSAHHIILESGPCQINPAIQASLGISPLLSIYSFIQHRWNKVSENATQCMEKENFHNLVGNTNLYRQWGRIFSKPSLQITSVLQWMRSHIPLLCEEEIQKLIEVGLFKPSLLAKKIHEEKEIVVQLREMVLRGIDYHCNHTNTSLFLIRVGICIETYITTSTKQLEKYEKVLLQLPKSYSLYCHLLLLYRIGFSRDKDSLMELICLAHNENIKKSIPSWVVLETSTSAPKGRDCGLSPVQFPNLVGYESIWFSEVTLNESWMEECSLFHSPAFDYWYAHGDPDLIVICKKKEYRPLYLLKGSRVFKLHSPFILVNIWENNDYHMSFWFERLEAFHEVCLWANSLTNTIEQFDLLDLDLTFRVEEGRFRSLNFPEFLLAKEQSIEALDYFEGALVLENETRMSIVLPIRPLQPYDANFSTQVLFREGFLNQTDPKSKKFYLFELDPVTEDLIHLDAEANLYLTLLFAMKRNYVKALHYLNKAHLFCHMGKQCAWVVHPFYDLKDASPEALAFYLRFALHLIQNAEQVILASYGRAGLRANLPYTFYVWTSKHYVKYLRIQTLKEINHIPAYIRLSKEEERLLLNKLQPALVEENRKALNTESSKSSKTTSQPHWLPIFDIRGQMLKSGYWKGEISPKNYSLPPSNMPFSFEANTLHIAALYPKSEHQFRVRFLPQEMIAQFQTLYDRMRAGKGEFDLFFLMRSDRSGVNTQYIQLLRYVHCYPDRFQGLNFEDNPTTHRKTLEEIVSRAGAIPSYLWKQAERVQNCILFDYHKPLSLSYRSQTLLKPMQWELKPADKESLHTLLNSVEKHFMNVHFDVKQEATLTENIPFIFAHLKGQIETVTTHAILKHLLDGYQSLLQPQYGKRIFTLKEKTSLKSCFKDAYYLHIHKKQQLAEVKEEAEKLANHQPKNIFHLGLRQIGGDLPEITMEGILTQSYLLQNPNHLRSSNPSLNPDQIERLMVLTIQYHVLRIHVHQMQRAIHILETTGSIQNVAEIIAVNQHFDLVHEPEIITFQSRTGNNLRPQQVELLNWEIETSHLKKRLFAAAAGEAGKTFLYTPIATKRLHRLGFTTFSASSKPLVSVDKKQLKTMCQQVFSFEIDPLELALATEATGDDFKWVFEKLQRSTHGYKLTPEVYYAFDLHYQRALDEMSVDKVRWLRRILSFFLKQGALLIDECRHNCSPFTQAKIGMGKPIRLPDIDCKTLLQIYRVLLSPSFRTIVRLQDNLQATMREEERKLVREAALRNLRLNIDWLKQESSPNKERALELIQIYFDEFFDAAMNLVWRMHHMRSIKQGENLHVPAHAGGATSSYFEDTYLTVIATIHGLFQEGVHLNQTLQLFEALEKRHISEVGSFGTLSEIEIHLRKWLQIDDFRISQFSTAYPESLERFHCLVRHNTEVIFWFLEHVILKEVYYSPEQISVTPIHFLNAFHHNTLFSADPGPMQIYGIYEEGKNVRQNHLFLAHTLHQCALPQNSRFIIFPHLSNPNTFFDTLLAEDPNIFSHLSMICDVGGMLRNFTVNEWVLSYFEMLKKNPHIQLDGLIMFDEASTQEEETGLYIWTKGAKTEIQGHNIPAALKSMGLDWEKLKLLTIIDASHRAGSNIEQPKGSSVLVLLGEGLNLSDDVQGKLRARGILKNEQWMIWGAAQKLVPLIGKSLNFASALEWELRNESAMIDKEILLSAIQQVDYWIEEKVRSSLLAEDDPHKQIEIWKRFRKGFVKQSDIDPIARFKSKQGRAPTKKVLWEYAKKKYQQFHYEVPWVEASSLMSRLSPVIDFAASRIPYLSTVALVDSRQHTLIFTFQREEIKQEQMTSPQHHVVPMRRIPFPPGITITSHSFITKLISHSRPVQEVFDSIHLTRNLYFTRNALSTAKIGDTPCNETYLKPVQYLLLHKSKEQWMAFAMSDFEAAFFQKELLEKKVLNGQLALLSADGFVAQNGLQDSQMTPSMLNNTFVLDVVIDVGLASCTLFHLLRFKERIEKWVDFWPMWERMKKWQPIPHLVLAESVERHVPEHIKKMTIPQKTQSTSFFSRFLNL